MKYNDIILQVKAEVKRFELHLDGEIAFIDYEKKDNKLFLNHTEVPSELEGDGLGTAIVEKALRYAEDNSFKIVPLCSFVQNYLAKHPEWQHLVTDDAEGFAKK